MLSFLGSLLSGGASLLGGLFGQKNQANINAANIAQQNYLDTHHIQDITADAKAAGINPLAALGVSTPSPVMQVGSDAMPNAINSAGQDIGRAVTSYMSPESKLDQLNAKLLQARIDNVNADTAEKTMSSSVAARTFAAPGSPPGLPLPLARPSDIDQFGNKIHPLYQTVVDDSGQKIRILSPEASQSFQNAASWGVELPVGAQMAAGNVINMGKEHLWRPDITRHVQNLNPSVTWDSRFYEGGR